jgi:DNA-binding NarL/FixJ family response regulator
VRFVVKLNIKKSNLDQLSELEDSRMRTLIADGQASVRSALRLVLEQEPGVSAVAEVDKLKDVVAVARSSSSDMILLDWDLASGCLTKLMAALRKTRCPCVVVLSGHLETRSAALDAGADYFVSKGDSPDQLISAVRNCLCKSGRKA